MHKRSSQNIQLEIWAPYYSASSNHHPPAQSATHPSTQREPTSVERETARARNKCSVIIILLLTITGPFVKLSPAAAAVRSEKLRSYNERESPDKVRQPTSWLGKCLLPAWPPDCLPPINGGDEKVTRSLYASTARTVSGLEDVEICAWDLPIR